MDPVILTSDDITKNKTPKELKLDVDSQKKAIEETRILLKMFKFVNLMLRKPED